MNKFTVGQIPSPPFDSDGIFWLRFTVPVPQTDAPLGVTKRVSTGTQWPYMLWVNGRLIESYGQFPPQPGFPFSWQSGPQAFPAGLVGPGASASVVVRYWVPPVARLGPPVTCPPPKIAPLDTPRLARLEAQEKEKTWPRIEMHFTIPELLLGILLLVSSAITRSKGQLRWFALLLIA